MRTKIFIIALALTAITFTGCKSTKVTTQEQLGNKEIELPCAGYDQDSDEYFTGMGIGENVNTMGGNVAQQDVQGIVEREVTQVIDRMMNDVEQTCEKMYQTQNGTYQSHIAIRISKKELVQQTATALSENEKLETLFNREQFRKWAEEYLKNYKK